MFGSLGLSNPKAYHSASSVLSNCDGSLRNPAQARARVGDAGPKSLLGRTRIGIALIARAGDVADVFGRCDTGIAVAEILGVTLGTS